MNRIKNLLPGIIESILCFLPIEEAVRTSILSREWRAELTDVSESSDGERMFDQPSEKKKLKQLTERHDKCVCEKCKKDHLCWQKWDSAPVNSRTGYTSCESVVIPVVQMVAWWDMEDTPELLFGQEVSVQVKGICGALVNWNWKYSQKRFIYPAHANHLAVVSSFVLV
ncbi:F-box/FBD/LRR-repeat protein [Tanacetum coccineum]